MEDSQLVELIQTLNPEERALARQLANVDYFNSGKFKAYCPVLLEVLLQINDNPDNQVWDKEEISKKVFGQETYVEGRLEKTMVEVHKVVKCVVQIQHYFSEENEFQQQFDLAKIAQKRGLEKRYFQAINKLQKQAPSIDASDRQNLYQHFLLEYELHDFGSLHNQLKGDLNVPNVLYSLELYLWLTRLELLNRLILQQKVAKIDHDNILLNINLEEIPERLLQASPLLSINHCIFLSLRKPDLLASDVTNIFELLQKNEGRLPSDNLRGLYAYLRNLCVIIFNNDVQNSEIINILHKLYQDNLRRGYLHYQGKLHHATYHAVCQNAIWVKNIEWAIEFSEKYKDVIIDETDSRDFYRLNLAACLFAQAKFDECLDTIPDSFSAIGHHLISKRLQLKTFYEIKSDLLPYRLDNYKMYLARTSPKILSDIQRQTNTDFLNLLVQLSTSIPGDTKRADTLIRRIKEKKQAAEWRWLMEKAEELKNPRLKNKPE